MNVITAQQRSGDPSQLLPWQYLAAVNFRHVGYFPSGNLALCVCVYAQEEARAPLGTQRMWRLWNNGGVQGL